jgi:hypothetical protein
MIMKVVSRNEALNICREFLKVHDKPNIVPEYYALHDGLGVIRMWNGLEKEFSRVFYPIRGDNTWCVATPMKAKLLLDRLSVVESLDQCKVGTLTIYDVESKAMVYVVDVPNGVAYMITHGVMNCSWCVRTLLGTINPTPACIYAGFFKELVESVPEKTSQKASESVKDKP